MKLATVKLDGQDKVGVVVDDRVYDLAETIEASDSGPAETATSVRGLLEGGQAALEMAQRAVDWAIDHEDRALSQPLDQVVLGPPLPEPGKLFCLAGNYAEHIREGGGNFPGKEKMTPHFFVKPWTTIIGTKQPIRIPPASTSTDWELELAVVIGKEGRDISASEADSFIVGYTIFNDISGRELDYRQEKEEQSGDGFFDWLLGKWPDTFGPMGPWITTADDVPQPDQMRMRLWRNDELHQDANTGQMIFSPAELIAFVSRFVTLHPGDVISTGTPAGVGHAKKLKLEPGDQIRGEIEGLGVLENSVEAL